MPRIWTKEINVEILGRRGERTLFDHLGMKILEVGEDFVKASMPVDERTKQPIGILNGGASCALVESVASAAGNYCVKGPKDYCVGLEINANHIRSVTSGEVIATAKPFHLGAKSQVWDVQLHQAHKLICVARMTLMVLQKD